MANIPEPDRKAAAADILAQLTGALRDFASWDKVKPARMEAYRETYTEEDLDGLPAFFNSPIGQIYLTKSVALEAKEHELNEKRQKEFSYIIQGMMKDWVEEHRKAAPSK